MSDFSENIVIRWLDRFGPLPKSLLFSLAGGKNAFTLKKILRQSGYTRSLSIQNDIISTRNNYFSDSKNVDALWVLSEMIESVNPININTAPAPSQVFFLKNTKRGDTKCYEIAVFYKGEEATIRTLSIEYDTKYIFVIPSCDDIDLYMEQINRIHLPCNQFLFAVLEYASRRGKPVINTYKVGGSE